MCLTRTRLDATPPTISPMAITFFTCVSCEKEASHETPRGTMYYAPSLSTLKLSITSFDDADSSVAFQALKLFTADETFPRHVDNPQCARFADRSAVASQSGRNAEAPIMLMRTATELDRFLIDLSSGVAPWSPMDLTATRGGWEQPSAGGWLGASGWNPQLTAEQQVESPASGCLNGTRTYETVFDLTEAQAACGVLDISLLTHGLQIISINVNDEALSTPSGLETRRRLQANLAPPGCVEATFFVQRFNLSATTAWQTDVPATPSSSQPSSEQVVHCLLPGAHILYLMGDWTDANIRLQLHGHILIDYTDNATNTFYHRHPRNRQRYIHFEVAAYPPPPPPPRDDAPPTPPLPPQPPHVPTDDTSEQLALKGLKGLLKAGANTIKIVVDAPDRGPCGLLVEAYASRGFTLHSTQPLPAGCTNRECGVDLTFPPLPRGSTVIALQSATSYAGLASTTPLDLVMLDDSKPTHPASLHGCTPGGRISSDGTFYQTTEAAVRLCWNNASTFSDVESSIWGLEWQVARLMDGTWDTRTASQLIGGDRLKAALVSGVLELSAEELTAATYWPARPSAPVQVSHRAARREPCWAAELPAGCDALPAGGRRHRHAMGRRVGHHDDR